MSDVPQDNYDADYPPLTSEVRNWAMLCHLSVLIGLFTGLFFLEPLVIWLLKRNDHPFIDENGKEALNFQISVLIYVVVLCCLIIGIPFALLLLIANFVLAIIAAIKASNGEVYRYPLALRLIS